MSQPKQPWNPSSCLIGEGEVAFAKTSWRKHFLCHVHTQTIRLHTSADWNAGDSWDTFSNLMPEDLLVHINGNAIYYVEHPWLRWLNSRLIEEAATDAKLQLTRAA